MSEAISNAINSIDAKRWVGEIERLDDEIAEFREEVKERRSALFSAAEAAGLPLAPLKYELWRRKEARKAAIKLEKIGGERAELADMIRDALGDFAALPLGAAAVEAADVQEAVGRLADSGVSSVTIGGETIPLKKRGRPRKSATPLVGDETGSDALSSLTDGLPN